MDRLQLAFAIIFIASVSLGGVTAADFGTKLGNIDASDVVKERVSVTVTDVTLGDEALAVTTRLENPTAKSLQLQGAQFRIHNRTNARLASGAGTRVDDGDSTLPGKGSLTVTHEIRLSDAQRTQVANALERDARLSMSYALTLGEAKVVVRAERDISTEGQ